MLGTFQVITQNFKLKPQTFTIDNWIFQFHYRLTTLLFLVACILVTSRQYIGEHIRCISDKGVPEHVLNTFCFFTSTFTVVKHYDEEMVASGNVAHPGVGPLGMNSTEPIRKHAYYQWVPFILFGQAIMFHLTHLIWKHFEGGRIRRLIGGMQLAGFAYLEKEVKIDSKDVPSKQKKEEFLETVRNAFIDRIIVNRTWARWLVFCEILNLINVILQVYFTDLFLGKQFLSLGIEVWDDGLESCVTPLDEVFPKVTKCTFYKYGQSGSIQLHDAMCVMALNIINEKIYICLWWWLLFLFIISLAGVIWRLITVVLHARSTKFNQIVFSTSCPGKMNPWNVLAVTRRCHFADWLFLKYLSKNMDGIVFRDLFIGLAERLDDNKPVKKDSKDPEKGFDDEKPLNFSDSSDEESGTGSIDKKSTIA